MELARVPYPTPNFFSPLSMDIYSASLQRA